MDKYMKLEKRRILVSETKSINLYEQTLFKANGEEGLHLWESSVIFSRYINRKPSLFEDKLVIELGSGCGLLGLACLMFTNCQHVTFSDYQDTVLNNLLTNISINRIDHVHSTTQDDNFLSEITTEQHCVGCIPGRYSLLKLDWREYSKFKYESFDLIIGSELIYSGGYIEELVKLIRNLLKPDGIALITMPEKRSMTNSFLKYIEENDLICTYKYIEDEFNDLYGNILEDEKQSKKLFEADLKKMKIILYEIKRKFI